MGAFRRTPRPPQFDKGAKDARDATATRKRQRWVVAGAVVALAAGGALTLAVGGDDGASDEVSLNRLLTMIDTADVDAASAEAAASERIVSARLDDEDRVITLERADGSEVHAGYPLFFGSELATRLAEHDVDVTVSGPKESSPWTRVLVGLIPLAALAVLLLVVMKRYTAGLGRFGGGAKHAPVSIPDTRFTDVVGADEAVADLGEVVDYLRDPARFETVGARSPRGVLLVGPPGTGKTLLARAVAGEAGVPFFAVSGSDFVEMFVGVGARRARDLFENANKHGKAVIFIDEIESVGRHRGASDQSSSSNSERENTLNALLVEMDGFASTNVVVLAATNRADLLDKALTRPGRFDRQVQVVPPDRLGREQLFELYLRNKTLAADVDITDIAARFAHRTPGMTGADIDNLTNEAALAAARDGSAAITTAHLEEGLERVILGPARTSVLVTDKARTISAWHEAGHTVTALVQPRAERPKRVSIVPRGGAGGVTWFGGDDDESFATLEQLEARMVVLYGGRAAEEMLLDGDCTRGASSDIAAATSMATSMVCSWGMSRLGPVQLDPDRLLGEPAEQVRLETMRICDTALETARSLLAEHREFVRAVAEALLERENLDEADLAELHGAYAPSPDLAVA